MALKFFDGYDHYTSATGDMLQRSGALIYTSAVNCSFYTGRNGYGYCLSMGYPNLTAVLATEYGTFYHGFALYLSTMSSFVLTYIDTTTSNAQQFAVTFTSSNGIIEVTRPDVAQGTTSSAAAAGTNTIVLSGTSFSAVVAGMSVEDPSGIGYYIPIGTKISSITINATTTTVVLTNNITVAGLPANTVISFGRILGISATGVITTNIWNYVEIGATIGSSGSITIRLNGFNVTNLNLSGINNQATSNAFVNGFEYAGGAPSGNTFIDDMYWCDNTTGPGSYPCNTFLGDVSVDTIYPISNGTVTWTPLANANWQEVSELQMDGDTSYNYTTTAGNVDTFNLGSLRSDVSSVYGCQVTGAYRKDDAGTHTVAQRIVASSTVENGATISIPSNYQYQTDLFVLDPATSASWTPAEVNSLLIGYDLVS